MSSDQQSTPTTADKLLKYGPWMLSVFLSIALSVVSLFAYFFQGGPVPQPPGPLPPFPQAVAPADIPAGGFAVVADVPPEETYKAFGFVADLEAEQAARIAGGIPNFADTPAGKAVAGDGDVFLWQAVRKANPARGPPSWYPNINQRNVGCCVGCGYKHGVDVLSAVQIVINKRPAEWKPVSAEGIYGYSRVEIGKGQIRGDGSTGGWAQAAVKFGVLPMEKFDTGHDLTVFDPARARSWGATGMPNDLEPVARKTPVKGTALVTTWEDVKRSITQGYPVPVCSGVGFNNPNGTVGTRDKEGFIRPRGSWPHCMLLCGIRGGERPGAFCLNSWGDSAHAGPVWPADAPVAGFWIDAAVVGQMVGERSSYALSDMTGFPARNLDWFADVRPARPARPVFDPFRFPLVAGGNETPFSLAH